MDIGAVRPGQRVARLPTQPLRRPWPALLAGLAVAGMSSGCVSMLEVQTLATGRSDTVAYSLQGGDLALLHREAERLCPLGGEVVRQFGQQQRPAQADGGRWQRALNATALWIDPPRQSAQLVVACRAAGGQLRIQPAAPPPAPAASAPAEVPEVSAALPVGPITPEW